MEGLRRGNEVDNVTLRLILPFAGREMLVKGAVLCLGIIFEPDPAAGALPVIGAIIAFPAAVSLPLVLSRRWLLSLLGSLFPAALSLLSLGVGRSPWLIMLFPPYAGEGG